MRISRRSRAWGRSRVAAPIALIALAGWGGRPASALDLTTSLPPPAQRVHKALDKAVDDAHRGLGNAVETAKRTLEAVGGGIRGDPQGEPESPGVATPARGDTGDKHRAHARTAQGGGRRAGKGDDIDELVASGDEIGTPRADGAQPRGRPDAPSQPLPFTGFDPLRLALAGLGMILAGLALLGSGGKGPAYAGRARSA